MNMNKKKIILSVIIGLVAFWTIGFLIAFVGYNMIRHNPIDTVAKSYLRQALNTEEFTSQYGAVKSIHRQVYPTKTETTVTAPYSVTTESYDFSYMVTLVKKGGEWMGQSYELYKVSAIVSETRADGSTVKTEKSIPLEQFNSNP